MNLLYKLSMIVAAPVFAFAAISSDVSVGGTVKSFDSDTVVLENRGSTFKVPRKSISKNYKLKVGSWVRADLQVDLLAEVRKSK